SGTGFTRLTVSKLAQASLLSLTSLNLQLDFSKGCAKVQATHLRKWIVVSDARSVWNRSKNCKEKFAACNSPVQQSHSPLSVAPHSMIVTVFSNLCRNWRNLSGRQMRSRLNWIIL